jgi:hypothetical protein
VNSKEIKSFHLIDSADQLPMDVFNVVCNQILHEILHSDKMQYMDFRDKIYDILIYNLDAIECIWCIFSSIISLNLLSKEDVSCIVDKIFVFLKYYNNNYRPIYHLESIFFTIITKIHE